MINLLSRFQVYVQNKFKETLNTKILSLVVIVNTALIASFQKICIDTSIDIKLIIYILFNSFILLVFIDVRLLNFLKLFMLGGISHILTSTSITLYLKHFYNMGKRCKIPVYIEGNFNFLIILLMFVGTLYWAFTSNSNKIEEKTELTKDKDFYG